LKDEGYIKFNSIWNKTTSVVSAEELKDLNHWRNILYNKGLIGMNAENIGFGNISVRRGMKNQFIITGSATGGFADLKEEHYTLVTSYNLSTNTCECEGPVIASSESLSHAAVYESNAAINAVIHIHNLDLWKKYYELLPSTSSHAAFGTAELAMEIKKLFKNKTFNNQKMILLKGHEEGIISFGKDLNEAGNKIFDIIKKDPFAKRHL